MNPSIPGEIKLETTRGSGNGGQHKNTTDSCVVVTHIATGIKVVRDGRNQHANKEDALKMAKSHIESGGKASDFKSGLSQHFEPENNTDKAPKTPKPPIPLHHVQKYIKLMANDNHREAKEFARSLHAEHGKKAVRQMKSDAEPHIEKAKFQKTKSIRNVTGAIHQVSGGDPAATIGGLAGAVVGKAAEVLTRPIRKAAYSAVSKAATPIAKSGIGQATGKTIGVFKKAFAPLEEQTVKESFYKKLEEKRQIDELTKKDVSDFTYGDLDADTGTAFLKDLAPVVGTARAAERTKQAYQKGEYGKAALHGLDTAVSAAGDAALVVPLASGAIKGGQALVKGGLKLGSKILSRGAVKGAEKGAVSAAEKSAVKGAEKGAEKSLTRKVAGKALTGLAGVGLGAALAGGAGATDASGGDSKTSYGYSLQPKTSSPTQATTQGTFQSPTQQLVYQRKIAGLKEAKLSFLKRVGKGTVKGLKVAGTGAMLGGLMGGQSSASGDSTPSTYGYSLQPKTSSPTQATTQGKFQSPTQELLYQRQFAQATNESIIAQLKEISTKTDLTKDMLFVNEEQININSNIAEKVIKVYEALNEENKAKYAKMLGESKKSFQRAVKFALRYR